MAETRDAVASGIRTLAGWAARTRAEDIPPEVMARAARVLADDLSAIIGARDEPEVAAFHQKTISRPREKEATVFNGRRQKTDRASAAVANAVAADWLELDEGFRLVPCHAGLYVIPALIAEAEGRNLPFRELLRALVLGYEIVTRVARTWTPRALNMQSHGRYCAVGAASAVALSRNSNTELLLDAISSAVTLIGPSPRNHLQQGILVRNVWPAMGAWSGLSAVEWAECGIAGDPGAFEDVYGEVLGGEANPEHLVWGLTGMGGASAAGSSFRWGLLDGYTKIYACCQHLHSAVEAAIPLKSQIRSLDEIDSIAVETHVLALPLMNKQPHTTLAAKFSMAHAMAATLVTGSGGADAFAATTLREPAIARLRERVSMSLWEPVPKPPNDRPARVVVGFKDGRTLIGECLSARGGPDRPLPPETVLEKMKALAEPAYPNILPVFEDLVQLRHLERGWADLVTEITK
jgi:2-methylcitrate dehydratase PrpD